MLNSHLLNNFTFNVIFLMRDRKELKAAETNTILSVNNTGLFVYFKTIYELQYILDKYHL